jgi:dolichyl-phosphate mannosyltransferase polypeptide 2 regulatory subunit
MSGELLIGSVLSLFTYYTFWVMITPFIDKDHWLQDYFPDRSLAIVIPTMCGVAVITIVATFIGLVMIRADSSSKTPAASAS